MTSLDGALVERAKLAARQLAPLGERIESERRLPQEAVRALVEAGAFKMCVPRALGGSEAGVSTMVAALHEIAKGDGSAGWCAMVGATSGLMSVYLEPSVARAVFEPRDAITSGVFAPFGRAVRAPGGYRVKGRWPFSSGCEHAAHRMGGATIQGEEERGVVSFLFRADETTVLDTWRTSGLCGTGSHDVEVNDVFVPEERAFSIARATPRFDGPAYKLPFFGKLAASVAAVALGIARAAVDELYELAGAKTPVGSRKPIAQRELLQLQIVEAESRVRAARANLDAAAGDVERAIAERGAVDLRERALLRAAASFAATEAAAAVDLAYHAGGATSIYRTSPLQRYFRDVHVATQHVMVGTTAATLAGRVLLGLDVDATML